MRMSGVGVADDVIRAFFERWKRLEEAKAEISDDLKELFAEMKGSGFDTKVARKVFRDKTVDQNERAEFEAIYDLYWSALSGSRAGRAREGDEATTPSTSNYGADSAKSDDLGTAPEHEPQPSLMAGKAAASIPPEVAAGNSENIEITSVESVNEPHMTVAIDANTGGDDVESGASARPAGQEAGAQPSGFEDGVEIDLRSGPDPKRASHSQSSDLRDGRLQAVPAPALDESRDSAAGVEAPAAPVNYPAPGLTTYEHCPPEPVRWHEYANCFPETTIDLGSTGVQKPIVKIGNVILDGRSRYHAARDAKIAYPVVQYAGSDPLLDVIVWNLEARFMSEAERRTVAGRLAKLVPDRTDEIMGMFGLEMAEAMA